MKLAIYARYSSDLQNPRSIDDQLRLCRDWLARAKAAVRQMVEQVHVFADNMAGRRHIEFTGSLASVIGGSGRALPPTSLVSSIARFRRAA